MNKIQLVEQHVVKKNSPMFGEIDDMCFRSKNLYNAANYVCRQEFFAGNCVLNYLELQKLFQSQIDYKALPAKVSQHVLKLVDKNWKSYFNALAEYKIHPEKFLAEPKIPKYKHKQSGRNILIFTNQAFSKKELAKNQIIKLSGTQIRIKTNIHKDKINQVRIVPKNSEYIVEIVYTENFLKQESAKPKNVAAIDLGVSNFATLVSNNSFAPVIYNGKPAKAINQFYNKEVARLQSCLAKDSKWSNKLTAVTNKRNHRIKDFLHKTSRKIVNQLVSNNIDTLIIGKNINWKQDTNLGKVTNQSFVMLPHARFIEMLQYKCKMEGIRVILTEESYTSKCSFLDKEKVKKHVKYKGIRKHRGLFISGKGIRINADVNSAFNIMKKVISKAVDYSNGIEAFVVSPVRISPY